jgi:hypothetical protein
MLFPSWSPLLEANYVSSGIRQIRWKMLRESLYRFSVQLVTHLNKPSFPFCKGFWQRLPHTFLGFGGCFCRRRLTSASE